MLCVPRLPEWIAVKWLLWKILSKMLVTLLSKQSPCKYNLAGEQLSTNIARFNNGQNNGSIAGSRSCVGDSCSSQIYFDHVILQSSIKGNWWLKLREDFSSFITSSILPMSCHCKVSTDGIKSINSRPGYNFWIAMRIKIKSSHLKGWQTWDATSSPLTWNFLPVQLLHWLHETL